MFTKPPCWFPPLMLASSVAMVGPLGAVTLTVLNDAATGPGSFYQALVEAVALPAESTAEVVFDEAFFAVPRTIVLAEPLPVVTRSVFVDGPALGEEGVPMVVISGDRNGSGTLDAGDLPGLMAELPAGGSLTVRRLGFSGCRSTANPGGAVYFRPRGAAELTLESCVFTGNAGRWGGAVSLSAEGVEAVFRDCGFVGNHSTEYDGGALHLGGALAVVERCVFRENHAPHGGAIHTFHGAAEIRGCHFESNFARAGGRGGAITARRGLRIYDSTFGNNRAPRAGGALYFGDMAAPFPGAVIVNSTFSANSSGVGPGGALYAVGAQVILRHVTMTLNFANIDGAVDPFVGGGAIAMPEAANINRIQLHNCLVAGNRLGGAGAATSVDVLGPAASLVSLGGNVVGIGDTLTTVFNQPGDTLGAAASPLEAQLGALGDNGGLHPTHLPAAGSPAIDAGVPGPDPVVATDQRGQPRPAGTAPDAGAVETPDVSPPDPGN